MKKVNFFHEIFTGRLTLNKILSLRYCTSFPQRVAPLPILFLQASRHLWIILSSIIGLSARPALSGIAGTPTALSWYQYDTVEIWLSRYDLLHRHL